MKATEVILRDHRAAEALFTKYQGAEGDAKEDTVKEIFKALTAHERMEDKHFYAALNERAEDDEELKEIEQEQRELELETMGIMAMEVITGDREERINKMMERVLAHAKKEEAVVLPKAEALFTAEELEEIGSKMEPDSAVAKGE